MELPSWSNALLGERASSSPSRNTLVLESILFAQDRSHRLTALRSRAPEPEKKQPVALRAFEDAVRALGGVMAARAVGDDHGVSEMHVVATMERLECEIECEVQLVALSLHGRPLPVDGLRIVRLEDEDPAA